MKKKLLWLGFTILLAGCSSAPAPKVPTPAPSAMNEPVESEEPSEPVFEPESLAPATSTISIQPFMQENSYYCVPACVQSVLALHGVSLSQSELASEMRTDPVTGTEYVDFARVVNRYAFGVEQPGTGEPGYRVQTVAIHESDPNAKALFFERIQNDLKTNDPVFCAIDRQGVFSELSSANHMILVIGCQTSPDTNEIESFTLFDPYPYETHPEAIFTVSPDLLWKSLVQNVEPAYIW